MDKICTLVADMLPLYVDGLCSENSKQIVEQHIKDCPDCRVELENMQKSIPGNRPPDGLPKKPFAKIKRHYIVRTIVIVLAVLILIAPVLWLVNTLRGEGFTYASFSAYSATNKAWSAIVDGDYTTAAGYMGFDENANNTATPTTEHEFVERMEALAEAGIVIKSANCSVWNFTEEGHHMWGTAGLLVDYNGDEYIVTVYSTFIDGKVLFYQVFRVYGPKGDNGYVKNETAPEWVDTLNQAVSNFSVSFLNE